MHTTTAGKAGSYNVTIWRVDAVTGKVISVQAGEYDFEAGKIRRSAGKWSAFAGTDAYHAELISELSSFAGEPCDVVVTRGTSGLLEALRVSFQKAYARHEDAIVVRFDAQAVPA